MPGSRYGSYVKPVLSPVPLAAARTFDSSADLTSSPLGNTPRLTLHKIPKATGANNLGDSSLSDDGTNILVSESILPATDILYDVGSQAKRFNALWIRTWNNASGNLGWNGSVLYPSSDNSFDIGTTSPFRWRNIYLGGKIQQYNGITPVAFGVPLIVAEGDSTGNTGTLASIAAFTVGAANGVFKIGGDIDVTAFTSGTINLQVTYTDWNSAVQTVTIDSVALLADSPGNEVTIMAKASTSITVKTTGTFTATYNVAATIIQVK